MRLLTLGRLRLEPEGFQRPKLLLLVAYLALERARPRDHLRDLFWPQAADPGASLRGALAQLRNDAPGVLEESGSLLSAQIACDAVELLEALDAGDWTRATLFYRGAFLDGFSITDWGEELKEWVLVTREFLARRTVEAHLNLAEQALARNDLKTASHPAARAHNLPGAPPLEPDALTRLYGLLRASNSPLAANVRLEAEELGLKFENTPTAIRLPSVPPTNLPAPLNAFVSRVPERQYLAEALGQPDSRLVTVTGPGGVGKSRLALEIARELHGQRRFPDGVFVVFLEAIESVDAVVSEILRVLQVPLQAGDDPQSRLLERLRGNEMLLVMDNLEHLIPFASQLEQLLEECPKLRVLVTSRERLGLGSEWVLPLEGLSIPPDADPEAPQHAVELFARRAQRINPTFSLVRNHQDVLETCRLVQGLPLAIELAAALVRAMPLSELVEALHQHPDVLEGAIRDPHERHHGMRAVFEHSWKLLKPIEQRTLARMTVFRDGATREAVTFVTEANLSTLVALVDKSLVQFSADGRYRIHPLLGQYGSEKLTLELGGAPLARQRHAEHYLSFLKKSLDLLQGPHAHRGIEEIEVDLENIRTAWLNALEYQNLAWFKHLRDPVIFFDQTGRYAEGILLFEETISRIEQVHLSLHTEYLTILAMFLVNKAWLHYRLGNHFIAEETANKAIKLCHSAKTNENLTLIKSFNVLSNLSDANGNSKNAIIYAHKALKIAKCEENHRLEVICLVNLANAEKAEGLINNAQKRYIQALKIAKKADDFSNYLLVVLNFSEMLLFFELPSKFYEVGELLETGLNISREKRIPYLEPFFLANLATYHLRKDSLSLSHSYALLAIELAQNIKNPEIEIDATFRLAEVLYAEEKIILSRDCLKKGLHKAQELNYYSLLHNGITRAASLEARLGNYAWAKRAILMILHSSKKNEWCRRESLKIAKLYNFNLEEKATKAVSDDSYDLLIRDLANPIPPVLNFT